MSRLSSIAITEKIVAWLKDKTRQIGILAESLLHEQSERVRTEGKQRFLRYAGVISRPLIFPRAKVLAANEGEVIPTICPPR